MPRCGKSFISRWADRLCACICLCIWTEALRFHIGTRRAPLSPSSPEINPASDRPLTFAGSTDVTVPPGAEFVLGLSGICRHAVVGRGGDLFILTRLRPERPAIPAPAPQPIPAWRPGQRRKAARSKACGPLVPGCGLMCRPSRRGSRGDSGRLHHRRSRLHDHAITAGRCSGATAFRTRPGPARSASPTKASAQSPADDGLGPNVLARFDRDVLAQAGVRWVIVFEGVNDLGGLARGGEASPADHAAIVQRITAAYQQIHRPCSCAWPARLRSDDHPLCGL